MSTVAIPSDQSWYFGGALGAKTFNPPAGCVTNAAVAPLAGIDATKLVHQFPVRAVQNGGANVVAATIPLHTFRGAGEIVAAEVVPLVAPAGGTAKYTVDVQKGNVGSAFATILSAPIEVSVAAGVSDREVAEGSLVTTAAADGDTLQAVVAVTAGSGTQGQGFVVTVWIRENPNA